MICSLTENSIVSQVTEQVRKGNKRTLRYHRGTSCREHLWLLGWERKRKTLKLKLSTCVDDPCGPVAQTSEKSGPWLRLMFLRWCVLKLVLLSVGTTANCIHPLLWQGAAIYRVKEASLEWCSGHKKEIESTKEGVQSLPYPVELHSPWSILSRQSLTGTQLS